MTIDEYVAFIQADDNELHHVEGIDIHLLPSDAPKTLNNVIGEFKPSQAQALKNQKLWLVFQISKIKIWFRNMVLMKWLWKSFWSI